MSTPHRLLGISGTLVPLLLSGLAHADPVPAPPQRRPPTADAGAKCRGIKPNGPDLTGTSIVLNVTCGNAVQLRVARLNLGITLDGKTLVPGVAIKDGGLASPQLSGPQLAGAMLLGETEDGEPVRLRIDSVATVADPNPKTPENENADVFQYRVSFQRGTATGSGKKPAGPLNSQFKPATAAWAPLCPQQSAAVVVSGSWNMQAGETGGARKEAATAGEITFACMSSAIAKCVTNLGYKPWRTLTPAAGPGVSAALVGKPVSMDAMHQACVRAVRADYCGNGLSMTAEGTQVNFYDSAGLQKDESNGPLEAVWTPAGALCVNVPRLVTAPADPTSGRPPMKTRDYLAMRCPAVTKAAPCDKVTAPDGITLFTEVTSAPPAAGSPAPATPGPATTPPAATPAAPAPAQAPPASQARPATRN